MLLLGNSCFSPTLYSSKNYDNDHHQQCEIRTYNHHYTTQNHFHTSLNLLTRITCGQQRAFAIKPREEKKFTRIQIRTDIKLRQNRSLGNRLFWSVSPHSSAKTHTDDDDVPRVHAFSTPTHKGRSFVALIIVGNYIWRFPRGELHWEPTDWAQKLRFIQSIMSDRGVNTIT